MLVALSLLASVATAQDAPHLWTRTFGAVAVNPGGLLLDSALEARTPVFRRDGAVFNSTFFGAGARVGVSPAHLDLALRTTFMPLDILPITIEGVYTTYWESPFGVVPMDQVEPQLLPDRKFLYDADRDYAATALSVIISPTFQVKFGKVSAFSNVAFTWIRLRPDDEPEPWVFEPYRGIVMSSDDRILEHTSAILFDPFDGDGTPIVRVGPGIRGRSVATTTDVSLMTGLIAQYRPGRTTRSPDFTLLVAPYLRDPSFEGFVPYVAVVMSTARIIPFKKVGR